jgi:multiple sugar transport system substrate-binding protein
MIKNKDHRRALVSLAAMFAVFAFLFSACDVIERVAEFFPGEDLSTRESESEQPDVNEEAIQTPFPTQVPIEHNVITVWVQPQFDPNDQSPASQLLQKQINSFTEDNPGVRVNFRLKAGEGINSTLNALSITAQAAPDALPTIVLLSRQDMNIAAAQGLIRPIESFSSALENNDWYPFANKMGKYHNESFGLPFAADVMVLARQDGKLPSQYIPLTDIPSNTGVIGFAAGNPQPIVPYIWLQSGGAQLMDNLDKPILAEDEIMQLFTSIETSRREGKLSSAILNYKSEQAAWDAFIDGDLPNVITRYSNLRSESTDSRFYHIPGLGQSPYTYAYGWVWCLVQKDSTDIDLNVRFMQHMVSPDFLADWTKDSIYSPVRPSSLQEMETDATLLDQILLSADIVPPRSVRVLSDSYFFDAINGLLTGAMTAQDATQNVLEQIKKDNEN